MTRLFLAPRSKEKTYKKNESSILQGVAYGKISKDLAPEGKELLGAQEVIFAWGNQPGKKNEWKKIGEGDWVMFYEKGWFTLAGRVTYKEDNGNLALDIWPANKKNIPWALTFFFERIYPISLSLSGLNALTGYKFKALMGFQEVTGAKRDALLKKFGSFEAFLSAYGLHADSGLETKQYISVPSDVVPSFSSATLDIPDPETPAQRPKRGGVVDFDEKQKRSRKIGDLGEEFVLKYEKERLEAAGRSDLADQVERVSLVDTGAGYDIHSFETDGTKRLIEVKATTRPRGSSFSFIMTRNELQVASESSNYTVWLVFGVESGSPQIEAIGNPHHLNDFLKMIPTQFQVKGKFSR